MLPLAHACFFVCSMTLSALHWIWNVGVQSILACARRILSEVPGGMDTSLLRTGEQLPSNVPMTPIELAPGTELGRYELLTPLAKGGMAQVWAARLRGSRGFTKLVAIKTILRGRFDDGRLERMFLEEASLAAQVRHPNVVETLELGEHQSTLYLVMEWVDGEPLHVLMHRAAPGGVPLLFAANLIGQACKGLHAAHELKNERGELLGVVHRDVSPQNILVSCDGMVKLVDFGVAKATTRNSGLTENGELKGKVSFMAPEQLKGQPVDRRSDVFALGIVLYELSTGRHPFKGDHPAETIRRMCIEETLVRPSTILAHYPAELERVVIRALERDPARRFASAADMLLELHRAVPRAFETKLEPALGAYLEQLLGERARERKAALRLAQDNVDRSKSQSCGSLRAITLDSFSDVSELSARSIVPGQNAETSEALQQPPFRAPKRRAAALGSLLVGSLLAAGLCAAWLLALRAPESPGTRAPVSAQGPPLASPPSASAAAPQVAAASPIVSASAAPQPALRSVRRNARPRETLRARPVTSSAEPVVSAKPAPPNPPAVNAWDPSSFGSRH